MADPSPPAGLLDRAGRVFYLAAGLGRAFQADQSRQHALRQVDPAGWHRHQPAFNEFCKAVLQLRGAMENPPDGCTCVVDSLLEAARVAKQIRDTTQRPDGLTWALYLDFWPHLNSVAVTGWQAIREVIKAQRLDDPFAFLDQPKSGEATATGATHVPPEPPAEITGAGQGAPDGPANTQHQRDGELPQPPPRSPKRSTVRGEGRAKLIAALTKHHQFAEGGCLNTQPIGNNDLANLARVSASTASTFFTKQFQGHTKYRALCRDSGRLAAALKLLNGEYSPHNLYGQRLVDDDG